MAQYYFQVMQPGPGGGCLFQKIVEGNEIRDDTKPHGVVFVLTDPVAMAEIKALYDAAPEGKLSADWWPA